MSDEKKNIPGAAPLDDSVPAETPSLLQRDLGLDRRGTVPSFDPGRTTPATPGPFQARQPLGGPEFAPTVISPKRDAVVAAPASSAPVPVPATSPFAKTVASATNPVLAKMQAAERDYAQRLAAEQKLAERVSAERKATERLVADRSRPPVATPGLATTAVVPPSAAQALRASLGSRPIGTPVSPHEMVTDPITSARVAAALAAPPRAPPPVKTDPLQTPDVAGAMARAPAQPPGLSPRIPEGTHVIQPDPTRLMRPPAPQPITSPMPAVARGLSPEPHADATNVMRGPGLSPEPHADATNVVRGPGLSPQPHADATSVVRGPGLSPPPHAERTNVMWGPPDPDRVPTAPVGQPAAPAPQRASSVAIPPPPPRTSSVAIPPPAPISSSVAIPPPPPRTSAVSAPGEQTTPGSPSRGLAPQAPAKAPLAASPGSPPAAPAQSALGGPPRAAPVAASPLAPGAAPQSPGAARPAIAPPGLASRAPAAIQNPAPAPLRPPIAAQSPTPVPAAVPRPPVAAPPPPPAARPPAAQIQDTAVRPVPLAPPAAAPRGAPAQTVAATPRALSVPPPAAAPSQAAPPGVPLPPALLRHGPGQTTEDDEERLPTKPNNELLQVTAAKPAAIRGNPVQVTVTPASPVSQREVAPPEATPPRPAPPPRATAEFVPSQPVTMPDRRPVSYEDLPPAMEQPKPLGPEFFRTQPGVGGQTLKGLTGVGPVPTAADDTTGPRPAHGPRDTAEQDKGGTVPQLEAITAEDAEAPPVESDQVLANVAPIWRRSLAWLLDLAIIAALAGGAISVLVPLLGGKPPPPALHGIAAFLFRLKPLVIPAAGAVVGLAFLYTTLFAFLLGGRTPGRLLFGIRLVDSSGQAPGAGRAFLRAIFALISFALFLSGFWLALFDRRGQTLHDKLTRTFVIRPV